MNCYVEPDEKICSGRLQSLTNFDQNLRKSVFRSKCLQLVISLSRLNIKTIQNTLENDNIESSRFMIKNFEMLKLSGQ